MGLFLSSEAGDINALRHTVTLGEKDSYMAAKPKLDLSKKVKRHRRAAAPIMCAGGDDDDDDGGNVPTTRGPVGKAKRPSRFSDAPPDGSVAEGKGDMGGNHTRIEAKVVLPGGVSAGTFPRAHGQNSDTSSSESDDDGVAQARMRARVASRSQKQDVAAAAAAAVTTTAASSSAAATGRMRVAPTVVAMVAPAAAEVTVPAPAAMDAFGSREKSADGMEAGGDGEGASGSDSDEYETASDSDSDSESEEERKMLKPVFVPKAARETVVERANREEAEEEAAEKKAAAKVARAEESRKLVMESLQLSAVVDPDAGIGDPSAEAGVPDDTDFPENEDAALDAWHARELARLVRDRTKRREQEEEKQETARRRGLSDKERRAEDDAAGKFEDKSREQRGFMQKYYHKGAFYMDEGSVRDASDVRATLDAGGATLEDKFDKKALPAVMQVAAGKFGRKGQTKYTHLADQDTTEKDGIWGGTRGSKSVVRGGGDLNDAGRRVKKSRI